MSNAIEFVETTFFTKTFQAIASDEELRTLQNELIAQPDKGKLMEGTGGLRKVRMAVGSQGKSSGARIIYLLVTVEKIYLVLAYPKSEKDTLTDAEKQELKALAKMLKGE